MKQAVVSPIGLSSSSINIDLLVVQKLTGSRSHQFLHFHLKYIYVCVCGMFLKI